MLLLGTDPDLFSETDLQPMLDALPPTWQERVTRKKPLKSRLQSAIGYSLLKKILTEHYHITALPAIHTNEYGKPYLENSDLHFSISHCDAAVACIVEEYPVAIDVQDILHDPSGRLKARLGVPPDLDDIALTTLGTQKEASAKLAGRGLNLPLRELPLKEHTLETIHYTSFIITIATNAPRHQ